MSLIWGQEAVTSGDLGALGVWVHAHSMHKLTLLEFIYHYLWHSVFLLLSAGPIATG